MSQQKITGQLVDAEQLLEALFTPESRPSLRWLREQTARRTIPYVLVGPNEIRVISVATPTQETHF